MTYSSTHRHETPADMAEALLHVSEGDVVQVEISLQEGTKETRQQVVDVQDQGPQTTIFCEECEGWNGPSIGFEVITTFPVPELRNRLKTPTQGKIDVQGYRSLEVNP